MSALFSAVTLAPRDPILGLNEQFNADTRPTKVNLGVGVYYDENGKLPLLKCVQAAEAAMAAAPKPRGYLPIDGIAAYDAAVQGLVFGNDEAVSAKRVATVQAIGGTGALKIGADFLKHLGPNAKVLISDPSWENHRALFTQAGFTVETYPYYDAAIGGINVAGMLAALNAAPAGTVVVLHACCHNPTGVDLSEEQWPLVVDVVKQSNLIPFLDFAYQGFGEGLEADSFAVRAFAESGVACLIASSFSKSFALYRERVGALTILTASAEESKRVLSQVKRVIRTNYSNSSSHGAQVVAMVLADAELRRQWEVELAEMRERIWQMRGKFVEALREKGVEMDFSFIKNQRGMFSYSGLSPEAVKTLREKYSLYIVGSGRVCLAAMNDKNIGYICEAIADVL